MHNRLVSSQPRHRYAWSLLYLATDLLAKDMAHTLALGLLCTMAIAALLPKLKAEIMYAQPSSTPELASWGQAPAHSYYVGQARTEHWRPCVLGHALCIQPPLCTAWWACIKAQHAKKRLRPQSSILLPPSPPFVHCFLYLPKFNFTGTPRG